MPSKILSFICHVPNTMPGIYSTVSAAPSLRAMDRRPETKTVVGGHFAAIYENDRFVRFKYINNNATS